MRFEEFSFGSIRIEGVTYQHDVVIDRCEVRKRNKRPSKKFRKAYGHTPLSVEEEIPWKRLYRVPPDVYFSHRRHVVLGEIECQTCHGDIGKSSMPPSRPLKISMKKCLKCHERRNVNNDCISCHR